jgi:aminomethyltransferase
LRGDDRALLALQGPQAVEVLSDRVPGAAAMAFMDARSSDFDGLDLHVSRSGYTGEDGYELSVPAGSAERVWTALAQDPRVKPIGLGARDSLRLEAGLCLYGHDIDPTTSPVEAGLTWSIQKRRREEADSRATIRLQREWAEGPSRLRVGLKPEGRAPAREGTIVTTPDGREVGVVTSGGFGPSVNGPIAMGYVARDAAAVGTELRLVVRGKPQPATVIKLPFAPHRYKR